MLNKKMEQALNAQINAELYSSYLYYAMSAHFQNINFPGMANWMKVQAQEELIHVQKYFDFIGDRSGAVALSAVDAPPKKWASPLAAFEAALEHEQLVTSKINKLAELATQIKDHATLNFLQWFIAEQVEEEATAEAIVHKLRLIGDAKQGLFFLDRELGMRAFAPSAK